MSSIQHTLKTTPYTSSALHLEDIESAPSEPLSFIEPFSKLTISHKAHSSQNPFEFYLKGKKFIAVHCDLPRIASMAHLYFLTHFQANYCHLKVLPEGLEHLPNLKSVDVSHNDLTEIPEKLFLAPKLHTLKAHHNNISKNIPISILFSKTLTTLELHHNPLEYNHFPSIEKSKKPHLLLKTFHLDAPLCTQSPLPMKKHRSITPINLDSPRTPIAASPTESIETPLKTTLTIDFQLFETILPSSIHPSSDVLTYQGCDIAVLSAQHLSCLIPKQLENITHIIIQDARVEHLLPKIQKAKNLHTLILQRCHIHTLAKEFFKKLCNLKYLDLSDNNLMVIPDLPTSLEICHLDNNRIKQFPKGLAENLLSLTLNCNALGIEGSVYFKFPASLKVLEITNNLMRFDQTFAKKPTTPENPKLTTLKMDLKAVQISKASIYQPLNMEEGYTPEYTSDVDGNWHDRITSDLVLQKYKNTQKNHQPFSLS